jgi:2-keto-3-deoxy-galactonokinase
MESERGRRIRSFLIGGLVGSAAGLVAAGRMRVPARLRKHEAHAGLAAFEQAPCYAELVEREREEAR